MSKSLENVEAYHVGKIFFCQTYQNYLLLFFKIVLSLLAVILHDRRKWITIVVLNVRWSSHNEAANCCACKKTSRKRRIMIRFCEFAVRDHDLDSERRRKAFHHEAGAQWFMARGSWSLQKRLDFLGCNKPTTYFFYQTHRIGTSGSCWWIGFMAHFYDLCWKVASRLLFVCLLLLSGHKV